jgi:hypothetical protein
MGSLEHNMTVNKKTKSQNKAKNEKVGTTKKKQEGYGMDRENYICHNC